MPGNDRGTRIAALHDPAAQPHVQTRFLLASFPMAVEAVRLEYRPHMLFKIRFGRAVVRCDKAGKRSERQQCARGSSNKAHHTNTRRARVGLRAALVAYRRPGG